MSNAFSFPPRRSKYFGHAFCNLELNDMKPKKKREPKELTPEEALEKARRFCNYQERCTSEVVQRLKEWNVTGDSAKKILDDLREETLLDDERFAKAFARGKFRIKNWGAGKIQAGLRAKGLSDDFVKAALAELPQQDQDNTLQMLLEKKNNLLKETNLQQRKTKLASYAMQKGYRGDKLWTTIDSILEIRKQK
jgi:regulatory protein